MQRERIHVTARAACLAALVCTIAALAVPGATATDPGDGGPKVRAAQYSDPHWNCNRFRLVGYGSSKKHRVWTWGQGGARPYTIQVRVKAQKCTRWTRVLYYPYIDARSLPRDRKVLVQFQSSGRRHKWKPACYKGRCTFAVRGGTRMPSHFGARPIVQFRVTTKGLLRKARFPNGAVQGDGRSGTWVAGPAKRYGATIRYYRPR